MIAFSDAQFLRRVPALFRAWNVFELAVRKKCDAEVDAGVLRHPLSFQSFVRGKELCVAVPFAVVGLRGIVEVLGIVKQRRFTGDMTEDGNDAVVGDKFEQLQQIIFPRPEISLLGQISDVSRRRATWIFLDDLLKDVVADAPQPIDLLRG